MKHEKGLSEIKIKISQELFVYLGENNFVRTVITDLNNKELSRFDEKPLPNKFGPYGNPDNDLYSLKYKKHFPHLSQNNDVLNWHQVFLSACELEYKNLTPMMRQLFILTKEKDMLGIKLTINAANLTWGDLIETFDSNNRSLLSWVALSKDSSFKIEIFDQLSASLCKYRTVESLSKLGSSDKNMLFDFAVGLSLPKQKLKDLMDAGADINHFNDGRTCLGGAVTNNDFDSVKNLVELGADLNATDNGIPPLEIALVKAYKDISEYLTEKGAKNESASKYHQIS